MGDADKCLQQCISKLDKALELKPECHEALSVYGSALNATAFTQRDEKEADKKSERAKALFRKALEYSPGNERYATLLGNTEKAPELYRQIMAEMKKQEAAAGGRAASVQGGPNTEKVKAASTYADYAAWVVLIGIGV